MSSAERTRRWRARRRLQRTCLPVEVDEAELVDLLTHLGDLDNNHADDRDEIANALSRMLARLTRVFLERDASHHGG